MDSQQVEIIGRSRLVMALTAADIEVATPLRDRGVDLIAYSDLKDGDTTFGAKLIQIKASSAESFSIEKRYAKFRGLILAHVWHVAREGDPIIYAMPYPEAVAIGKKMGWTLTDAWNKDGNKGRYTSNKPSTQLKEYLEPYRMGHDKWRDLLMREW